MDPTIKIQYARLNIFKKFVTRNSSLMKMPHNPFESYTIYRLPIIIVYQNEFPSVIKIKICSYFCYNKWLCE